MSHLLESCHGKTGYVVKTCVYPRQCTGIPAVTEMDMRDRPVGASAFWSDKHSNTCSLGQFSAPSIRLQHPRLHRRHAAGQPHAHFISHIQRNLSVELPEKYGQPGEY